MPVCSLCQSSTVPIHTTIDSRSLMTSYTDISAVYTRTTHDINATFQSNVDDAVNAMTLHSIGAIDTGSTQSDELERVYWRWMRNFDRPQKDDSKITSPAIGK